MVVFDVTVLPKDALQKLEDFSRKFKCDLELLHIGTEIFGGAEAIDKAVEELREKLGGDFHVTSTIVPLGFFKSRRAITNSVIDSEGARVVILPDIDDAVSDILLHSLVLSASVPVCVLR